MRVTTQISMPPAIDGTVTKRGLLLGHQAEDIEEWAFSILFIGQRA